MKPLFIPLKAEYFEAFERGEKDVEYRKIGARWNYETCKPGRPVVLSYGYGKARRLLGVVTSFEVAECPYKLPGWVACYGHSNHPAACIGIKLEARK
jgi:hypothetical protein